MIEVLYSKANAGWSYLLLISYKLVHQGRIIKIWGRRSKR